MTEFQGKRLEDDYQWNAGMPAGAYWKAESGWFCVTPNGHYGNLSAHDVIEHENGTITVSPSILVSSADIELWHGFLKEGVWTEC